MGPVHRWLLAAPAPPVGLRHWHGDARVTVVGLALVAPIVLAMMVGSGAVILLASVIVLAASLLSPVTGLVALAFMAPFPRPLEIPAPGLYVAIIGSDLPRHTASTADRASAPEVAVAGHLPCRRLSALRCRQFWWPGRSTAHGVLGPARFPRSLRCS